MHTHFVATSIFLVDGCAYSRSFCGVFGANSVNMFSSVTKIMLTSLGEYFSATVSNGRVFHGSSLHSALGHGDFLTQTFHKVV